MNQNILGIGFAHPTQKLVWGLISPILGELRSAIWQEYGGLKCLKTNDRKIRDLWIKEKRGFKVLS